MDVSRIAIRMATPDDAKLLTEMGARTFAETFAVDNTESDMAMSSVTCSWDVPQAGRRRSRL